MNGRTTGSADVRGTKVTGMHLQHQVFQLHLNMLTDWHIGSGLERPGAEDRLVRRDPDGLPFVPAKTLTAMIRDAAEQIAMGQQPTPADRDLSDADNAADRWLQWVLFLFGDQPNRPGDRLWHDRNHAARISIRPAYLAEDLRDLLRPVPGDPSENAKRREFREALVFTKPGVKIGRNGQAMNKHLRFDEMVRSGLVLTSSGCYLDVGGLNPEQVEFASRFLNLAVEMTERLGAKRRRGSGRVKIALVADNARSDAAGQSDGTADMNVLAEYFEHLHFPPPLPQRECRSAQEEAVTLTCGGTEREWDQVTVVIELKTPLMALERTVGNIVKSLDFVPGTLLLSLVARILRPIWPDVDRAVVSGDLRVSPATIDMSSPESKAGPVRGLPTPACLFHPKGGSDWFATEHVSNRFHETKGDHVKDFRGGYVRPPAANLPSAFARPRKIVAPHNTVDEEPQRPTSAVGGVYAYEAIAAGTCLCAEIRLRRTLSDEIAQRQSNWWERLNGDHALGRSRKDDYGLIRMTTTAPLAATVPCTGTATRATASNTVTIWLTSDVLLRDDYLRTACTANDLAGEVVRALGLTASDVEPIQPDDAFLHHRRIESWHVGWGLPRASLVAIAAGSCLRLRRTSGAVFDASHLANLEANGIGLRRAEGFGMLLVNHPLVTQAVSGWKSATERNASPNCRMPLLESTASRKAAGHVDRTTENLRRRLETEVWRQRVGNEAIRIAANAQKRESVLGLKAGQPRPAQAAVVRNLLQFGVATPQMRAAVLQRLDHVENFRGDRWPPGSLKKIRDLISGTTDIRNVLGCEGWPRLSRGPDVFATDPDFCDRAVRMLIQAILKAHQSDLEKSRRQDFRVQGPSSAASNERSSHGS